MGRKKVLAVSQNKVNWTGEFGHAGEQELKLVFPKEDALVLDEGLMIEVQPIKASIPSAMEGIGFLVAGAYVLINARKKGSVKP